VNGMDAEPGAEVEDLRWYPAFEDLGEGGEDSPGLSELVGSLTEMPEHVTELARWAKVRYQEAGEFDVGTQAAEFRSGSEGRPRTGSWVMRLFWHPLDDAVEIMAGGANVLGRSLVGPSLRLDATTMQWDEPRGAHVIDGRLRVPWSRPALRVRLSIEARSTGRTLFTLTITSKYRLVHPKRFYEAGHRVLEDLDARLGTHRPVGADAKRS